MILPFCDPILDAGRFRLYMRLRFTLLSAASRALLNVWVYRGIVCESNTDQAKPLKR